MTSYILFHATYIKQYACRLAWTCPILVCSWEWKTDNALRGFPRICTFSPHSARKIHTTSASTFEHKQSQYIFLPSFNHLHNVMLAHMYMYMYLASLWVVLVTKRISASYFFLQVFRFSVWTSPDWDSLFIFRVDDKNDDIRTSVNLSVIHVQFLYMIDMSWVTWWFCSKN